MRKQVAIGLALILAAAGAASADEQRELGAHEHGVGKLDIAFEANRIVIGLEAPGADIAGFEHEAKSAEDRAAVERAIATLEKPLDLLLLPAAAGCEVTQAHAELAGHDHDHEKHDDHAHSGEGHAGEAHAGEKHGDDHAHAEGEHSEFRAEYALTCADPAAVTQIDFAYFKTFPNARELEIRIVSDKGAKAFEVTREAPALDLKGQI